MKRIFILTVCAAFLCFLSGCASYKSDMAFTGILPQNVATLDPQTASGTAAEMVVSSIFEGLCRIDENGETMAGAAKSWEQNSDATEFTFHLRGGAKWSDGSDLTADDFLFAIQRALRPETGTPAVGDLFLIKNARAIYLGEAEEGDLGVNVRDERTLVFQLEKSYPDFPAITARMHYMPCNRAYFEESAGHYGLSSEYLVTNGPFTFSSIYSWRTDNGEREIDLVRSDGYRGDRQPAPEALTFLIDYDSAIDADPIGALKAGDVDILPLPEDMALEAAQQGCGVTALEDAVAGLLLNSASDALENVSMRELFVKSLNRDMLLEKRGVKTEQQASGIMADCVRWNGEPYYADGAQVFAQQDDSIAQAIPSLLSMLELQQLPAITVICPDDERSIGIATEFLISWNENLGGAFNMEPLPDAEFQSRIFSGDYEAALYTLRAGGSTPYEVLKAFEASSSPVLMQDKEFDDALHTLSFDLASFRELEGKIQDNYVFDPLFKEKTFYATNPSTRDIAVSPNLSIDFTKAKKKG